MKQLKSLVCSVGMMASFSAIAGTARYVDPGGNDANSGSIIAPYKTITKAVSASSAGDTIYVRGGTHIYTTTVKLNKSGTASNKFYLYNYPGERPLLSFSGMAVNSNNKGVSVSGNFWHLKGIDIYRAGDNGMNVSGDYNVIEYCSFFENYDTGLQFSGGADNDTAINCDSYFNADATNENADGFAAKLDVGSGIHFSGCRAWQNSDDGWDGYLRPSDNVTWSMDNCWCFANGYLKSGAVSAGNGNGFKMGGSDNADLKHDIVMTRCLAFNNRVKGFDQNNDRGSITLLNCTAYNNGTNYGVNQSLASGEVMTVKNCVSGGTGAANIHSSAVLATNSWQSPFAVSSSDFLSTDTTGVRGARNPDGSLPVLNFMRLATGSDLIDAGTNVGLPYTGTAPDLGCFEKSAVQPNGIINTEKKTGLLKAYPNPCGAALYVNFTGTGNAVSIQFFNTYGQLVQNVFEGNTDKEKNYQFDINTASFATGNYYLVLRSEDYRSTERVEVVR